MIVEVLTDHPIALDSPDHIHPWGTAHDNSICLAFNEKLRALFDRKPSVLDLGCSGGGMVKSLLDEGHFAIGIEGSDYSKVHDRAEWVHLADTYLFTADITEHFLIVDAQTDTVAFDVVTLWEVLEHIHADALPALFQNIGNHLKPDGFVIASVCQGQDASSGFALHQTVQLEPWWTATFAMLGWRGHPDIVDRFGADMVRGGDNATGSFHVVLTRANGAF